MKKHHREFKCLSCGHEWKVPFGGGRQLICPQCGSQKIKRTNPGRTLRFPGRDGQFKDNG